MHIWLPRLACTLKYASAKYCEDIELNAGTIDNADGPEELYERIELMVDRDPQEPMRLDKFLTARIEKQLP